MVFAEGNIYPIYNRGNNFQPLFFYRENYLFFLDKMKKYLLPYADVLAWCLMPNHFHWMILVNRLEVVTSERLTQTLTKLARKRTLND